MANTISFHPAAFRLMLSPLFKSISVLAGGLWLCSLAGCATYEFEILSPTQFHQHVGHGKEVVITNGPLEYRLVAVEDRLVMQIFSEDAAAIRFLGEHSSEIDPSGQLHPLRSMTLPPTAHMKFVLPPVAHLEPAGPRVGFGVGIEMSRGGYGPGWGDGLGYMELGDETRYVAVYDAGEPPWDWPADADVRLLLTFQRGDEKPFTQEWVLRKRYQ